MKLSDMFSSLAENARSFEERVSEWQEQMNAQGDDMMASARKWQEATMQRQEELNKQMQGYFDEAGENVRTQWETMQSAWEEQFQTMQKKGEEMRASAMKSGNFADWAEAYAAQMVTFAQKMQDEAANAIAAATEARGKSDGKKKG
ncbi:hypothetical protein [Paracoccus saliphilus]|uniref:Uncharacterized protein n=1 Tax=Paracoccus saliphilus TaxID=405559 RepID=A0AA45W2J6_9RHOB|nr:hypothetical protein [Paracoccus saliphilus]WCR02040.1 hypothetical protein JHX88_14120 [Paracoccus saliphilus]SIS66822.1 hypothetical protein SAMN05421772_102417 [Paracoccus saliphilus]